MIRAICQRGKLADAVGVAVPTVFDEEGRRMLAVDIKAELGGRRGQRMISLHRPEGAPREVPLQGHARELGEVPEGAGWIGVDPMVNWELGVIGPME